MGGAIGGILFTGGTVLSTAASVLEAEKAQDQYYEAMAATAEAQAKQMEETAARNAQYTFENAGYQNSALMRNYSSLLGQQKTALAASGLSSSSATAQMILKNSRLNALMDQEMLNDNMDRSISEMNTTASLQAMQQRTQAQQYRRANSSRPSVWLQMGSALGNLFSGMSRY